MTEQDRELWPGRYRVFAKVEIIFPFNSGEDMYNDTWMELYQPSIPEYERVALLAYLGWYPGTGEDNIVAYYIKGSQAEDTFSEQQADKLIAFLETYPCMKAWKRPAYKPERWQPGVSYRILAINNLKVYDFSGEPFYSLDFKARARCFTDVEAYRKFGGCQDIIDFIDKLTEEEATADEMYQEKQAEDRRALIKSINLLISNMTVEALQEIELNIARM